MALRDWSPQTIKRLWLGLGLLYVGMITVGVIRQRMEIARIRTGEWMSDTSFPGYRPPTHADTIRADSARVAFNRYMHWGDTGTFAAHKWTAGDSARLDSLRDSLVKVLKPVGESLLVHAAPVMKEIGQQIQRAVIVALIIFCSPPLALGILTLLWWRARRQFLAQSTISDPHP